MLQCLRTPRRLVVDSKTKGENLWLQKSKLGKQRRPDTVAKLPPFNEMLHVESLSADSDLLNRERTTTSLEKLAAQKGVAYAMTLLGAMLDGMNLQATDAPLLIVDFSPHLGCNALAVRKLQASNPAFTLTYMSLETDKKDYDFSHARIRAELAKEWFQEAWQHPSIKPQKECPPLPRDVVDSIPGAREAMGDLTAVEWKVLHYVGGKLNILEQHTKGLATSSTAIRNKFMELEAKHLQEYQDTGGGRRQ